MLGTLRRHPTCFETLERRVMLSATVAAPIGDIERDANGGADVIDLTQVFTDPNSVVRLDTVAGIIDVELFNAQTPLTVANFRNYVNSGRYNNTIIHRSLPGFIIQGGGFDTAFNAVAADPPILNEPAFSNVRGTISMAKIDGQSNSATSQWFINLADNSGTLDSDNGGFSVFGRVVPSDMGVVDSIAQVPRFRFAEPFEDLPVVDYSGSGPVPPENTVFVTSARELPLYPGGGGGGGGDSVLRFEVSSDNPDLVSPGLDGTDLVLQYGAGGSGTANVTVRAIDLGGFFVDETFRVDVAPDPGDVEDTDSLSIPDFTEIADVAVQPDGKFVIVGYRLIAGDNDFAVARINADRTIDRSFGDNGSTTLDVDRQDDRANAVAVDAQGRIVVVGTSGVITDENDEVTESNFLIARFNPDGSRDTTFGSDPDAPGSVEIDYNTARASVDEANGVAIQPADGKIVVVGASDTEANFSSDVALVRLNPDGSLDAGFFGGGKTNVDFSGFGGDDSGEDVALQADGKIVVTGQTATGGVLSAFATLRFNPDGLLDQAFGTGGGVRTNFGAVGPGNVDEAYSVDIQPADGKIVVGGLVGLLDFTDFSFTADFGIVRYNTDGSLDQTFGISGGTRTDFGFLEGINRVVVQDDGDIIASGQAALTFQDALDENLFAVIARYNPNGSLDTSFEDNGRKVLFQQTGGGSAALRPAAVDDPPLALLAERDARVAAAADDDLEQRFDQFASDAQGIVAATRGGAIAAFAADAGVVRIGVIAGGGGGGGGAAPTVFAVATPVTAAGIASTTIVLRATDDVAVAAASLNGNGNVLEVITPGGGSLPVIFVAIDNAANAATINVTYRVDAPGGTWDPSENGTYTVRLRGDQVRDADGLATGGGDLGTLAVDVPLPPAEGPDLVVASLTGVKPGSFLGGSKGGGASVLVRNQGNRPLAAPVSISLFFSTDQVVDASDGAPLLTMTKTLKLKTDAAKAIRTKFNYPGDRPDGDYFVLARLDGANAVAERDEANNDGSNGFSIRVARPFVDLVGVPPAAGGTFAAGRAAKFSIGVRNGGNVNARAAVQIQLLASTDTTRDAADVQLNAGARPAALNLKPGASKTSTVKFNVPANLPAGNYFLVVLIDPDNVLPELDDVNTLVSTTQFSIVG